MKDIEPAGSGSASRSKPLRWFEDVTAGDEFVFGDYPVTKEEVIEFASRYDPQPYHTDEVAAAAHPVFGRLCASGMHTMAMAHLLQMRGFESEGIRPLAGTGLDELRMHLPVFPGDVLTVRVLITEMRAVKSRSDRGLMMYATTVLNQEGKTIMTSRSALFLGCRA